MKANGISKCDMIKNESFRGIHVATSSTISNYFASLPEKATNLIEEIDNEVDNEPPLDDILDMSWSIFK